MFKLIRIFEKNVGTLLSNIELNLLISLLRFTKEKPALIEDVNRIARMPADLSIQLLQKMQSENLVYLTNDYVRVDGKARLQLAVKAVNLGADVQTISDLLCWQEFEEIAAIALKNNGYTVHKNLRFKGSDRRYEIDVVGCRKPIVICIDCKRWKHAIGASTLRKIIEDQTKRTQALANSLPNPKLALECTKWDSAKFIPAVLSLMSGSYKFYYEVPVVSALQLQDFVCQLLLHVESLKCFPKRFNKLR